MGLINGGSSIIGRLPRGASTAICECTAGPQRRVHCGRRCCCASVVEILRAERDFHAYHPPQVELAQAILSSRILGEFRSHHENFHKQLAAKRIVTLYVDRVIHAKTTHSRTSQVFNLYTRSAYSALRAFSQYQYHGLLYLRH